MIFPFNCPKCEKGQWLIKYNTETKSHKITCAACGFSANLEEIFGKKPSKPIQQKPTTKPLDISRHNNSAVQVTGI
jgi:transcription elongation factor Elf1